MIKKQVFNANISFALCLTSIVSFSVFAGEVTNITSGRNTSGDYEIQIGGSGLSNIKSYNLRNPSRIVVDIPNAQSNLKKKITKVVHPVVSNIAIIEGDDRVRATVNLVKSVKYDIVEKNGKIVIVINDRGRATQKPKSSKQRSSRAADVDFVRSPKGQGRIVIKLQNASDSVDVVKQGDKIIAKLQQGAFKNTKRLNVLDFATPVKQIDVYKNKLSIATIDDSYEMVSYQNENEFSIEFSKKESDSLDNDSLPPGDSRKKYSGEPLSLNFQDIDVRSVLSVIGEFTNTNIVVDDSVTGNVTLRLNNVPWDQALDIILQTKGLTKQSNGEVIFVAASDKVIQNTQNNNSLIKIEESTGMLQQQLIQILYSDAKAIEKIIEDNSTKFIADAKEGKTRAGGLLSARGNVSTDPRTNTLIVNDVPKNIEKVRRLIAKLDVPVKQVLIDARIVQAQNTFAHELGVHWGFGTKYKDASKSIGLSGNKGESGKLASRNGPVDVGVDDQGNLVRTAPFSKLADEVVDWNRLGVANLGANNPVGTIGAAILGRDFILDMELSAMEAEGRGEVISSPRVIAQDGGTGVIKQGTQLAYSKIDKEGVVTTTFKEVPLMLEVSPKIAPNNQVNMDLNIVKDTPGAIYNGEQGIDSNSVKTQVTVQSGETVVLGGVFEQIKNKSEDKVPVLGDLPIVGRAFRRDLNNVTKRELLIFVTPKILDGRYTSQDKFSDLRKK